MRSPYEKISLENKVIIVTGGCGGIGGAAAEILCSRGASVLIADRETSGAEETLSNIRAAGGRAIFLKTDVTQEADVEAMVAAAVSEFGGLHGAFNNAGISNRGGLMHQTPLADWHKTIGVNMTGVFLCMKHQIAYFLEHGGGSIVNTSSGAGILGFPHAPSYVASKHGVAGLTRAAAVDYSSRGIRVNAILPGGTDTPMLSGAMERDPTMRAAIERTHPIGRLAHPSEQAEAAAWLLSDAASFVTGACFAIDGGYSAM